MTTAFPDAAFPPMTCRARDVRLAAVALVLLVLPAGLHAQDAPPAGLTALEAVRVTLVEQPQIQLSREQVIFTEGTLQAIAGRFDTRLNASADRSRSASSLREFERTATGQPSLITDLTQLRISLERPLRSGLILAPTLGLTRQDVNLDPPAANRASIALSARQPLLRGRGTEVVTAEETAARFDVDASTEDLRHTAATGVLRTTLAYWSYLAAARNLEVIVASETRARTLVDETRELIDAGNRPAADLQQVLGNLAERRALRASAEQALFATRQDLGLAMGLPTDRSLALPTPVDAFPALVELAPGTGYADLLALSLAERADLEATRHRQQATEILVGAARNGLKPQLDLNLTVGLAGLAEGTGFSPFVSAFGQRVTGPTATASLFYSWPTANNTAAGLLARSQAISRQTQIQLDDLARGIRANVVVAHDDLARSAERVRAFRDAAAFYRTSVDAEREKLQLGLSTIIDLILIEDRLTRSLIDEIVASQSYAQALARLRFETGTLVSGAPSGFRVDADALTTMPPGGIR